MKSVQAGVVLCTFRDKFGFQMDDYIYDGQLCGLMAGARSAEAHTYQAA